VKDYLDRLLQLRTQLSNLMHEISADDYIHPEAYKQLSRHGSSAMNSLQDAATLCWCIGTGMPTHQWLMRGGIEIEPQNYQPNYETIPF